MAQGKTVGNTAAPTDPLFNSGVYIRTVLAIIDPAEANSDAINDVITLAKGLPLAAKIVAVRHGGIPTNGGVSDVDIGFYRADNDAVIDIDVIVDGADLSTAIATGADLMVAAPGTGRGHQSIGTILSLNPDQCPAGGVNLCATMKSEPTGTGLIKLFIDIAFPA
jgi:hypothetical protein